VQHLKIRDHKASKSNSSLRTSKNPVKLTQGRSGVESEPPSRTRMGGAWTSSSRASRHRTRLNLGPTKSCLRPKSISRGRVESRFMFKFSCPLSHAANLWPPFLHLHTPGASVSVISLGSLVLFPHPLCSSTLISHTLWHNMTRNWMNVCMPRVQRCTYIVSCMFLSFQFSHFPFS